MMSHMDRLGPDQREAPPALVLCKHQDSQIAFYLLGRKLRLTRQDAVRLEIETIVPSDLTERIERCKGFIVALFERGNVEQKCSECGHNVTTQMLKQWFRDGEPGDDAT